MTVQADIDRRPTALIVDDASTVRMFHRIIIEQAGWRVIEAENGIEALERILDQPIDLMLVDVNMPVMDGYRFIESVRAAAEISLVPAIIISTEAETADAEKAFSAGANHYLVKPVKPDILTGLVNLLAPETVA